MSAERFRVGDVLQAKGADCANYRVSYVHATSYRVADQVLQDEFLVEQWTAHRLLERAAPREEGKQQQ